MWGKSAFNNLSVKGGESANDALALAKPYSLAPFKS